MMQARTARVVLTGATGFVGQAVMAQLLAAGHEVTALLRSGHGAAALQALGVRCHVRDPGAAMAGADVLVNLAHDFRAGTAANLAAFGALMAAARAAGIGRIVHASSIVVYDAWPFGPIDETSAITPGPGSPYRNLKIEMENSLLQGEADAVILQPTLIYGRGSALWTDGPIRQMRAGGVVLPEPAGQAALVHVADVAGAIAAAVGADFSGRERFCLTGPAPVGWDELMTAYARIAGLLPRSAVDHAPLAALRARAGPPPPAVLPDPGPSVMARLGALGRRVLGRQRFATLTELLGDLRGGGGRPAFPDHYMLDLYQASPRIETGKLERLLGFRPEIDFAEGLRRIVSASR